MTTPAPGAAAEPAVLFAQEGPVAVLTLNRPASLNSFTRQMHRELWAALDKVEANKSIRALVLTGAVYEAGEFRFRFMAQRGRRYCVQSKPWLCDSEWQDCGDAIEGQGAEVRFSAAVGGGDGRGYRVLVVRP